MLVRMTKQASLFDDAGFRFMSCEWFIVAPL